MPLTFFAMLLTAVIAAAALTIWLLTLAGPAAMIIAAPLVLTATATVMALRR